MRDDPGERGGGDVDAVIRGDLREQVSGGMIEESRPPASGDQASTATSFAIAWSSVPSNSGWGRKGENSGWVETSGTVRKRWSASNSAGA